jgi:hypothetical protein
MKKYGSILDLFFEQNSFCALRMRVSQGIDAIDNGTDEKRNTHFLFGIAPLKSLENVLELQLFHTLRLKLARQPANRITHAKTNSAAAERTSA